MAVQICLKTIFLLSAASYISLVQFVFLSVRIKSVGEFFALSYSEVLHINISNITFLLLCCPEGRSIVSQYRAVERSLQVMEDSTSKCYATQQPRNQSSIPFVVLLHKRGDCL